jgi:protein-export membrane protein SecD
MTSKSIGKFAIVIIIIALLAYIAAFGLQIGGKQIHNVLDKEHGIRRGIDLAGGSELVFEPSADAKNVSDADIEAAQQVLKARLDSLGYTEATVSRQGEGRIRVEIPSIANPEDAVEVLGETAVLTFRDVSTIVATEENTATEETKDEEKEETKEEPKKELTEEEIMGTVVLEGDDVKSAKAEYGPVGDGATQAYKVTLKFTSDGAKKFAEATDRISKYTDGKNVIAIYLDENLISAPRVSTKIDSEECYIEGDFTNEEAKKLAAQIQGGKLPFSLELAESRTVGATLGEKALDNSLTAALIGTILVMLFMIFMYRMCGFVSCISLVGYISIVALILGALKINLTLPGIAGVILTIGTAVDANVVIFERIKEELSNGKTIRAAVDSGFHRAFSAILDSNVTTVIAAVVLYLFGTGTIQSFAITLFIGTVVSMFTAIVITRFLLRQLMGFNLKNPKLYCAYKEVTKNV